MSEVTLDFCGMCGSLLPAGLSLKPKIEQVCMNCNFNVSERRARLEGAFSAAEAKRMYEIFHQEEN